MLFKVQINWSQPQYFISTEVDSLATSVLGDSNGPPAETPAKRKKLIEQLCQFRKTNKRTCTSIRHKRRWQSVNMYMYSKLTMEKWGNQYYPI